MQLAFHLLAVMRRLRIYESGRDVQKLSFAATSKAAPESHDASLPT
jgi:hypothetical protein